jgi:hypothetical protein
MIVARMAGATCSSSSPVGGFGSASRSARPCSEGTTDDSGGGSTRSSAAMPAPQSMQITRPPSRIRGRAESHRLQRPSAWSFWKIERVGLVRPAIRIAATLLAGSRALSLSGGRGI